VEPVEDAGGVRLPDAWDRERGSPAVLIAQIDTGILAHADLDPLRTVPGYDFISDRDMANDGDGRDADPADPGDWVAAGECGSGEPAEASTWHGTQVAGIIGATTDNGAGIAAVNHGSRLLMARVLSASAAALPRHRRCAALGRRLRVPACRTTPLPWVINLSLGGGWLLYRLEQDAIDEVNAREWWSGGGGQRGGDVAGQNPANCQGVVTVAARRARSRAAYTNTGSGADLSAPGASGDAGEGLPALSTPAAPRRRRMITSRWRAPASRPPRSAVLPG
jgi:serine protease